jgi:hypothetical protein
MFDKFENDNYMFIHNMFYSPSILSFFEKEKNSKKPFIVLHISDTNSIITNKNKFFHFLNKIDRSKLLKINVKKDCLVFYFDKKVVKYQLTPTKLKIDKL